MVTMEIFALGFIGSAIATKANSGYRVVARVADNIIKVLFR